MVCIHNTCLATAHLYQYFNAGASQDQQGILDSYCAFIVLCTGQGYTSMFWNWMTILKLFPDNDSFRQFHFQSLRHYYLLCQSESKNIWNAIRLPHWASKRSNTINSDNLCSYAIYVGFKTLPAVLMELPSLIEYANYYLTQPVEQVTHRMDDLLHWKYSMVHYCQQLHDVIVHDNIQVEFNSTQNKTVTNYHDQSYHVGKRIQGNPRKSE